MKNFMLRVWMLSLKQLQETGDFTMKCSLFYKELGEKEIMTDVANSFSKYWGADPKKDHTMTNLTDLCSGAGLQILLWQEKG